MKKVVIFLLICFSYSASAQTKILFDATKAETAANADWVIDEDSNNLGWSTGPAIPGDGNEGNAQRIPTPAQSGITQSTAETFWKGGISAWGIDCVKAGYQVETLPYNGQITYGNSSNAQDLSNYKVFVVCEPNILFTTAEKTALMNFVQNGGGLFMVSDHGTSDRNNDGYDSPEIWNDLMSSNGIQSNPFGLTFNYVSVSPNIYAFPNLPGDPLLHGPMGDVAQIMWSAGTTMTLTPASNSSVKAVAYSSGTSGNNNVMVAYATYGSGKVVAFGDSSPCDDGTGDSGDVLYDGYFSDAAGNHQLLIMNATIWLATSTGPVPAVTTSAASSITTTSATLNGTVNPNGVATTYDFDWGSTASYGTTTSSSSAGSGSSTVSASAAITGLNPGTTYHFRITATNSNGTTNGSDQTFTAASPSLAVTPANQNVGSASGNTSFSVTSNTSWTVMSDQSWCTTPASGSGNGTLLASYSANSTISQRIATITVTVSGVTPVTITVTQSGATPTLGITPANQSVSAAAGSTDFNVVSNTGWTVSSDQAWCTVPSSGTGNGTLTASFTQNSLATTRTATLTISVSGMTPVEVTVVQSGIFVVPEPSNYPTGFSGNNIRISWIDATGEIVPDGYLVRMSTAGFSEIADPVDGIPVAESPIDKNIPIGVQEAWFGNLLPSTTYYFKIFEFKGAGSNINYRVDADNPEVQITTN